MLILFCLVIAWGIIGALQQAGTDARTGVRTVRNGVRQRAAVRAAQIRRQGWRSPARWGLAAGMGAYRTGVYTRATYRGARRLGRSLRTGWVAGTQRGREKHTAYVARRQVRRMERAIRTDPPPTGETHTEVRAEDPVVVPHRTDDAPPEDSGSQPPAGEPQPTQEGTVMPSSTGGEALNIDQARQTLKEIYSASSEFVSTVDNLQSSLASADLDPQTLGEVAEILDAAQATQAAADNAVKGLDARHSHMEEAVNSTPHPAKTEFYQH